MTDYVTKDSGERRPFDTGAHRDVATGKGRYDLLPPEGIKRLAQLFERGAEKYDDRNWEMGIPLSVYADSMLRHAFQAANGHEDEDHLAAVAWNALCMLTTQVRIREGLLPAELDDLPDTWRRQAEAARRKSLEDTVELFRRMFPKREARFELYTGEIGDFGGVPLPGDWRPLGHLVADWKVDSNGEASRPLLHPEVMRDLKEC